MLKNLIRTPQKVVIDTIPLLLFLIGGYDTKLISEFKRLKSYHYSVKDFKTLYHTQKMLLSPPEFYVKSQIMLNNWRMIDFLN